LVQRIMRSIIGIDPGMSGAITVYSTEHKEIIVAENFRLQEKSHGKGKEIDGRAACEQLKAYAGVSPIVYLERVKAMPRQGVSSMFSFGRSFGLIEGIVFANKWPIHYPLPNEWKKHHGISGKDKSAALTLFKNMEPGWQIDFLPKEQQLGIADSYLIARFGAFKEYG